MSDLYIPTIGLPILLQEYRWTGPGNIYSKSLTDTPMWKLGLRPRNSFSVNTYRKWDLRCSALYVDWWILIAQGLVWNIQPAKGIGNTWHLTRSPKSAALLKFRDTVPFNLTVFFFKFYKSSLIFFFILVAVQKSWTSWDQEMAYWDSRDPHEGNYFLSFSFSFDYFFSFQSTGLFISKTKNWLFSFSTRA